MSQYLMNSFAIVTAFVVGFAMKYGGLCTYAAAVQIVRKHRYERLLAFLGAAAWAALVVVPLAWSELGAGVLNLSGTHQLWVAALAGGAVLGLGAWLNRGCVFGTFVQLTGGNLNYLVTLLGMAAGAVAAKGGLGTAVPAAQEPTLVAAPGGPALLWLTTAAVLGVGLLFDWRASGLPRLRVNRRTVVMLTLGIGGGWLYAAVTGWTFAAAITGSACYALGLQNMAPVSLALLCALAMVAGGISAAIVQRSFEIQLPRLGASSASFGGGALMGAAAVMVPGGNDGLLLSGIPAFAPHAIVGYLLMVVVMLLLLRFKPGWPAVGGRCDR